MLLQTAVVLASWLPGRTANAVKQALKKYIEAAVEGAITRARLAQQRWPDTLLGVLNAWPGVAALPFPQVTPNTNCSIACIM